MRKHEFGYLDNCVIELLYYFVVLGCKFTIWKFDVEFYDLLQKLLRFLKRKFTFIGIL